MRFFQMMLLLLLIQSCGTDRARPADVATTRARAGSGYVHIERDNGRFVLMRGGKPYQIKGAGLMSPGALKSLAAAGANSLRVWDIEGCGRILDEAYSNNMTVCLGFWVGHERHGFDYHNPGQVSNQFRRLQKAVETYRNHPALLFWAIGNEAETESNNPKVWAAIQDMAAMVHRLDPDHPTVYVHAGAYPAMNERFAAMPDIDIVGINDYGTISSSLEYMRRFYTNKPFIVTEFGPDGWWESEKTEWDAYCEAPSGIRRMMYGNRLELLSTYSNQCFGSYAFVWGTKQERTATWFSLVHPTGELTEAAMALSALWTGRQPANDAPELTSLLLNGMYPVQSLTVEPGTEITAAVEVRDRDGDKLKWEWQVFEETTAQSIGGDAEAAPAQIKGLTFRQKKNGAIFQAPARAGFYRLFVTVRDGRNHAASASFPFKVR